MAIELWKHLDHETMRLRDLDLGDETQVSGPKRSSHGIYKHTRSISTVLRPLGGER